jgi:curved DNA-binding protein
MAARDFYEVLGVARTARQEEIQRAYRTLARRHHPDLNAEPDAAARFGEVTQAYEVLSDPERRARYDLAARQRAAAGGSGRGRRVHVRTGAPRASDSGGSRDDPFRSSFERVRPRSPHPTYRVSGRDITVEVPVTPWEAALGASIPVPTPAGTARVDLPAGSSSGQRLRLRGYGLRGPGGPPGDLYAEIRIVVPPSLTPVQRELFARLAAESTFDPRR